MTKREAMRRARIAASAWLDTLVASGWPWSMQDDEDPPESDEDCEKMQQALSQLSVNILPRTLPALQRRVTRTGTRC
jgi:hypothetical protein